jgi:Cu+-exporting ATPase
MDDVEGSVAIASPETDRATVLAMVPDAPEEDAHDGVERTELARIAAVALASVVVWLRLWEPLPHISVVGLAAALVGGYPILREALSALAARRMTMELSMTIAMAPRSPSANSSRRS